MNLGGRCVERNKADSEGENRGCLSLYFIGHMCKILKVTKIYLKKENYNTAMQEKHRTFVENDE